MTLGIGPGSIRRQDLLCLILYYLGFSRIRNLIFRLRRMPVARILAFHDVPYSDIRHFREKLEVIQEVGNVISLDDIVTGRMSWKKINVAITFDDGYRGWYDNVFPVLRDLGITATFFVSCGFIGVQDKEERNFIKNNLRSNQKTSGSLAISELRTLADNRFTIGGHTLSHVNLSELSNISKVCSEIQKDKMELERITKKKVEYFAYPFGFYQNTQIDIVKILQDSGYKGAVTLTPGLITANTNSYYLHRDLVSASMPMSVFKARLLGNHDGVMYARKILLQ